MNPEAQKYTFTVGAADGDMIDMRLAQLGARSQAASLMDKPWKFFWRENKGDWPNAPFLYTCFAKDYRELEYKLDRARRFWGVQRTRYGNSLPISGCLDWENFGNLRWGTALNESECLQEIEERIPSNLDTKLNNSTVDIVFERVCKETGYEPSELNLSDDWQLDLAIDSLKLASILSKLWEQFGVGKSSDIDVSAYPTLGHVVTYLQSVRECGEDTIVDIPNRNCKKNEEDSLPAELQKIEAVVEVGVCRGDNTARLRREIASHLGIDECELRMRKGTGWAHLRNFKGDYCVTTSHHPLRGYRVIANYSGQLKNLSDPYVEPIEIMSWLKYRMGDRDNAWIYAVGALFAKFIGAVNVAKTMESGPKIFLSNHQTAIEGYLFPLLAPIWTGLSLQGVAMIDHGISWADDISTFMFSHEYFPRHLLGPNRGFTFGDTLGLLRLFSAIERDMSTRKWGLHIVASGQREWIARQRLTEVSSLWLEMALRLDIPIVPVRFCRGLPLNASDKPQDFPIGLGSQTVFIGPEIPASSLDRLNSRSRKLRVLQALNDFPIDEEMPTSPDIEFSRKWREWVEYYGGDHIATLVFACLERFIDVKEEVEGGVCELESPLFAMMVALIGCKIWAEPLTLILPNDGDGRWVASLVQRISSPKHIEVILEGQTQTHRRKTVRVI